ncbi:MAG TPA: DinB family protein [Phycisphaerales bacterium]|nr:DinB family protein [Phycisphaerales bacterium]
MLPHHQTLLAYERHATAQVADALTSVPPEARVRPEYAKALSIFAHTQQAAYLWLARLGGIQPRPFNMFPDWTVEQTVADAAAVHEGWQRFLDALSTGDLTRAVEYTSTEGARYRGTVGDIVTHVFNHASYHRGQIAMLVTALGGTRAVTDYIAFTRLRV